ncbi:MAG: ATP-binding protein [Chloroflexota bacterium]|jgi:anti-sigma regulatory factor (Ser/Thr protein kinase)
MREITLHLLDITENSVSANAKNIQIKVVEDLSKDLLQMVIQDDGKGMDAETMAAITDPFVTSRKTRKVGLGIPLFKEAAEACNGDLNISSELGKGTCIDVRFQYSHIDRMPLGDLAGTVLSLIIAHADIHWQFDYSYCSHEGDRNTFEFDDQPIKETLGDIPLTEPAILSFLRESLYEGISSCINPN